MRIYVAGSTRDVDRIKGVQDAARAFGHTITFDWTGPEGEIRTDGSWDSVPKAGASIASREIAACWGAEITILLFPPQGGGLGCWIEMGATLAAGGDVWVVEPGRDSVFWQHPSVTRFPSIRHMMGALAGLRAAA